MNEINQNYNFSKNKFIIFDMYTNYDYQFNELIDLIKKNNKILINFLLYLRKIIKF
jgi:hypothetical protein